MSEPFDTFDLDRAFDDLTRDVSGVSPGRGAARAVQASRRRRAAGAGVAAVAVLTAGGLALTALGDDPAREVPVAPDVPDAVTPAPLTAAALAEATSPWVESWTEQSSVVLPDAPCARARGTKPRADEAVEFRNGQDVGADRIYTLWRSPRQAADVGDRIAASFARCQEGPMRPTSLDVPGATVTSYAFPDADERRGAVWLAVAGDRLALLTVVAPGAPSAAVRQDVAEALVAGLTYDEAD